MWIRHSNGRAYSNAQNIIAIKRDESDIIVDYVDGSVGIIAKCANSDEASLELDKIMTRLKKQ